jgi:hypothetical protein
VIGLSEPSTETAGSIRGGQFLDQLGDRQFLKEDRE